MPRKLYFVNPAKYVTLLKPALGNETEITYLPKSVQEKVAVYRMLSTGAALVYQGHQGKESIMIISAASERTIKRTKSKLEKLTNGEVKLTELGNGGQTTN
jgi:hypothetical protein